jgi:hypothetical protein
MVSIQKFEKIIAEGGFIPKTYYSINGYCIFVEVISVFSADSLIISIPKKYKFKIDGDNNFKLKYIEMNESGITAEEYGKMPDEIDIEKKYDEIDIDVSNENEESNMESYLEDLYKRPIFLKDMNLDDRSDVKDIFRQLKRFKFCVQSIPYKLCIIFKNYMCILNNDDTVYCFLIKNYNGDNLRKLLTIIDLELLFKNIKDTQKNITTIKKGIHKILNKNQTLQTGQLQKIMTEKANISLYNKAIFVKKEKYRQYIVKLENYLKTVIQKENKLLDNLEKFASTNINIYNDATNSYNKSKIEEEINKLRKIKENILKNIMKINKEQENLYLSMDKIWFDSIVMLDALTKNFSEIQKLSKN